MLFPPEKVRFILPHENQKKSDSAVISKYVENVNSFSCFTTCWNVFHNRIVEPDDLETPMAEGLRNLCVMLRNTRVTFCARCINQEKISRIS